MGLSLSGVDGRLCRFPRTLVLRSMIREDIRSLRGGSGLSFEFLFSRGPSLLSCRVLEEEESSGKEVAGNGDGGMGKIISLPSKFALD